MDALYAKHLEITAPERTTNEEAYVEEILFDYYEHYARHLDSEKRGSCIYSSVRHFAAFLTRETKAGRIRGACKVSDLTPTMIRRFHDWRANPHSYKYLNTKGEECELVSKGVSYKTADTNSDYVRAGLNWAWKERRIEAAPYIPHVAKGKLPGPRDRVMTMEEIGRLFEVANARYEKFPQDMHYLMAAFSTGGRPEAICDMNTDWCLDIDRRLLNMNEPGRPQTRKLRPTVPILDHHLPWLLQNNGWIVSTQKRDYEGNISTPYGGTRVANNRKSFEAMRREANLGDVSRVTIRHTVATILRERGVDEWEADGFTGHSSRSTTGKNYAQYRPDYFSNARKALDQFFVDLGKYTKAHLRYTCDTRSHSPKVITFRK